MMIKKMILALSSLTLAVVAPVAFANPEAENMNAKPPAQNVLLVRTNKEGVKTFFKVSQKVSPADVPAVIEEFQKTGKANANIVQVKQNAISTRNPKNPEAEGEMTTQSWHWHYNNYRYGRYPGAHYYSGYWPRTYYYYQTTTTWAPVYRYSYGCHFNYTWGIYW
jgi:hypothetical protein